MDVLVNSLDELRPVGNGRGHIATEDVIKIEVIGPLAFNVIDFKLHVRGHP